MSNYSKEIVDYVRKWELDKIIPFVEKKETGINDSVDPAVTEPYQPHWDDLCRLHELVIERKIMTVLEFGCGYSSLIFAHALKVNKEKHADFVTNNLRRHEPFKCYAVDDMKDYIEIAEKRVPTDLKAFSSFMFSPVHIGEFNGRICTYYEKFPNVCPDLIYLDGPSQFAVNGEIAGITLNHPDKLPMAADILRVEHFLLPGTLILVDGRSANARFLQANFQRNWEYRHSLSDDVHWFELREKPLGKYNEAQIRYCLGDDWLDRC